MPVLELRCFYVSQFSIAYPCEEIFCYCLLLTWNKKSLRFVFKIHWYWRKKKIIFSVPKRDESCDVFSHLYQAASPSAKCCCLQDIGSVLTKFDSKTSRLPNFSSNSLLRRIKTFSIYLHASQKLFKIFASYCLKHFESIIVFLFICHFLLTLTLTL